MIAAAEIGAAWVILCVSCAAGLSLGERLLIMARLGCDWADAGARQRVRARKRYAKHAAPRASSKPVIVPVAAPAIERADRMLDHTHVIPAVQDDTVITGVAAVRPVDVRPCCGTREGSSHLSGCLAGPP